MSDRTSHPGKRFARNPASWAGAFLVGLALVAAIGAPWLAPYDPDALISSPHQAPSAAHWLGSDGLGRDILSRVIFGARTSLFAGGAAVALALAIGATAGATAGYLGGATDQVVSRGIDMLMAFPSVLIALLFWIAFGAGWVTVLLAVALINIPTFARQIRATVVSVRHAEYLTASRALGAGPIHILTKILLPVLVSPLVVLASLGIGSAILEVAGLSFLGVSGPIHVAEWGAMLSEAKSEIHSSIWPAIAPGAAISLTVLGCNLLGDGIRDAVDPKG
ncbi:MAG TPA: ABC transporter permease [Pirellulales bacterium]